VKVQGTYLPAKIGLDLEEMQHYQLLRDQGKQVKKLYEKLHRQHALLRRENPDIVHRCGSEKRERGGRGGGGALPTMAGAFFLVGKNGQAVGTFGGLRA